MNPVNPAADGGRPEKGGPPGIGPLPAPKPKGMFARLNPRGVPVGIWPDEYGKWPLLVASDREGDICAGSRT